MPSLPPAASVFPSGLKASGPNVVAGPVSGAPSEAGLAGLATLHSQAFPSAPAAARIVPPWLKATLVTSAVGPPGMGTAAG
jgi:hypothetical protein